MGHLRSVYNYYGIGGFTSSFLELEGLICYLDECYLKDGLYIFSDDIDADLSKECDKVVNSYTE
jgi:hypothetical protein